MFSPTDLSQTNAAYFLTRWITHLCAPTFVFLAGTSAFLSAQRRHYSRRQLSFYLIRRGIILILLELTVIRFGWTFNWDVSYGIAQVVWALGWAMLVLAGISFLPRRLIVATAISLIAGHNLFDAVQPDAFGNLAWIWTILHVPGNIEYLPGYSIYMLYPLIPWIGIMALGYSCGPLLLQSLSVRQRCFLWLGVAALIVFIVLRLSNLYGDPQPWSFQNSMIVTVFSILKCEKYPPSLLYALMTLGIMFLCLALFESQKQNSRISHILLTFGKAPLLFYIVHIYLIHGLAYAVTLLRKLPTDWLVSGTVGKPFPEVPSPIYGFDLTVVYGIWLLVLAALYPMCEIVNRRKVDSTRISGTPL